MSNVIQGPWGENPPQPQEEYDDEEKNLLLLQALVVELTDILYDGIRDAGFDNLEDLCYTKDLALIAESVRSYLLKLQERYHPMQDVADHMFEWGPNGELTTNSSISVDFLPDA